MTAVLCAPTPEQRAVLVVWLMIGVNGMPLDSCIVGLNGVEFEADGGQLAAPTHDTLITMIGNRFHHRRQISFSMASASTTDDFGPRTRKPKKTKGAPRTSQQVRAKFFQRIGISLHRPHQSVPAGVRDLRNAPRFYEPLQYDHHDEILREQQRKSRQSAPAVVDPAKGKLSPATPRGPRKQVSFEGKVAVVPIPMRNEYSDRVSKLLWSDAVEMCENVGRSLSHSFVCIPQYLW